MCTTERQFVAARRLVSRRCRGAGGHAPRPVSDARGGNRADARSRPRGIAGLDLWPPPCWCRRSEGNMCPVRPEPRELPREARRRARVEGPVLVVAVLAASSVAHAQPAAPPALDVDPAIDVAVAAGAVAAIALPHLIPVGPGHWDLELWGPVDRRVRDNFSTDAAALADATVFATVAVPVLFEVAEVIDDDTRRAGIAYTEAIGISLGLNAIAKYTVQRPRPYTYHPAPGVRSYALAEGDDAYLSFYSGHATTAFAAAVAGSYLYGLRPGRSEGARSAMWFTEIALATATS